MHSLSLTHTHIHIRKASIRDTSISKERAARPLLILRAAGTKTHTWDELRLMRITAQRNKHTHAATQRRAVPLQRGILNSRIIHHIHCSIWRPEGLDCDPSKKKKRLDLLSAKTKHLKKRYSANVANSDRKLVETS